MEQCHHIVSHNHHDNPSVVATALSIKVYECPVAIPFPFMNSNTFIASAKEPLRTKQARRELQACALGCKPEARIESNSSVALLTLLDWLSLINLLDSISSSLSSKKCSLDPPTSDLLPAADADADAALLAAATGPSSTAAGLTGRRRSPCLRDRRLIVHAPNRHTDLLLAGDVGFKNAWSRRPAHAHAPSGEDNHGPCSFRMAGGGVYARSSAPWMDSCPITAPSSTRVWGKFLAEARAAAAPHCSHICPPRKCKRNLQKSLNKTKGFWKSRWKRDSAGS
uniref:Uncharacterized protein n=1 Tax=Oryza glumipatula TaxID=40148 RepID=A0A0D9Z3T9_9ORYZ